MVIWYWAGTNLPPWNAIRIEYPMGFFQVIIYAGESPASHHQLLDEYIMMLILVAFFDWI